MFNSGRFVKGHKLSLETRQKMSEARKGRVFTEEHKLKLRGKNNPDWRGDKASYTAKHQWVYRWFGKARECERANETCKGRFEWSNISNEYQRVREDWQQLCRSHHIKYDYWRKHEQKINS